MSPKRISPGWQPPRWTIQTPASFDCDLFLGVFAALKRNWRRRVKNPHLTSTKKQPCLVFTLAGPHSSTHSHRLAGAGQLLQLMLLEDWWTFVCWRKIKLPLNTHARAHTDAIVERCWKITFLSVSFLTTLKLLSCLQQ